MNRFERIGIFDSGVGGLELLVRLERLIPNERIYYFADTVNNPYGEKDAEVIERYLEEIIEGMLLRRVKLLVIACNTASVVYMGLSETHPLKQKLRDADVDVIPIVTTQAVLELALANPQKVLVVGTELTIKSKVYEKLINTVAPDCEVLSLAAQSWVNRVENPLDDIKKENELRFEETKKILNQISDISGIDAVVLGCTHFPEFTSEIKNLVGERCLVINPAVSMAHFVKNYLKIRGMLIEEQNGSKPSTMRVFTNGDVKKIEKRLQNLGIKERYAVRKVDIRSDFSGKVVEVVGYGATGKSLIKYLAKQHPAVLCVRDKSKDVEEKIRNEFCELDIKVISGDEYLKDIKHSDVIFRSPGVPAGLQEFSEAKRRGVPVMSDVELFLKGAKGKKVAITGTNGKTTTTILARDLFSKHTKGNSHLVGNVGKPVLDDLEKIDHESVTAIELSSFQLEELSSMPVDVAILLNITPDHLDRHGDMAGYIEAKGKIFTLLKENSFAVYNNDSEEIVNDLLPKGCKAKMVPFSATKVLTKGAFLDGLDLVFRYENVNELRLENYLNYKKFVGEHNLENLMASALVAYLLGVEHGEIKNILQNFAGVKYRIEHFYRINNVDYFDDSKGTNPDATIKAIRAMTQKVNLVAGGINKGIEFEDVALACKGKVRVAYLFDEIAAPFEKALKIADENIVCVKVESLEEATTKAYESAKPGEAVLFSPACASPSGLKYYQRGNQFKEIVSTFGKNELKELKHYLDDPLACK